jgi:adenosylcobyric acid synthase
MSKLYVVGTGPGDLNRMTLEARDALVEAQVVVGYKSYLELVAPLLAGKEVISTGMMKEVERCREALRIARSGKITALVSGGDAGIYGMAGLVLELVEEERQRVVQSSLFAGDGDTPEESPVEVVVIPGVSAVQAAAARLGAPLMHDFAVISLSDLLTPWEVILRRLEAAAAADFVVALYNPRSAGRVMQLDRAREILLASRKGTTPVGIVRNACRKGEAVVVTTLTDLPRHEVDMTTIVIIGNASTYVDGAGKMVTPRGYQVKGERLKEKGEPPVALLAPGQGETNVPSQLPAVSSSQSPVSSPRFSSRALMICGTGSDVGKSVLAAGICRLIRQRGLTVAPFKSQNMALNSAVTPEGGEIGRAQAVQAAACGIPSHTDMNPILLKPNSDVGSQVIVQGKPVGNMTVAAYNIFKPEAFKKARESFLRLKDGFDFIVADGAGSLAEINLKAHDIANLKVARMAGCPVLLVADIDRGGVFAQIIGTWELLEPAERALVKGLIINKFRGDPSLLASGLELVEKRTGLPVLGVVPYLRDLGLPEEDSVALTRKPFTQGDEGNPRIRVGVVKLPRISNYTDFDLLEREPDVELSYLDSPHQLAGLDLLIIPGTKSTIPDLEFLEDRELFQAIREFPGPIMGICGGFQMLGRRISDPHGVESSLKEAEGLGLLDAVTLLLSHKETHQVEAMLLPGAFHAVPRCRTELTGYEIHMGETILGRGAHPFARITRRSGEEVEVIDGAVSPDGRIIGTYIHGILDNHSFRTALINRFRKEKGLEIRKECEILPDPFDRLANHLAAHLDMPKLWEICGLDP